MNKLSTLLSVAFWFAASPTFAAEAPQVIDVKVTGHGKPVIFIPGLATSGAVWNDTVRHLQDKYECHVVNIAGFGAMPPVKTSHLLEDVRDQIIAYARTRKLEKPTIIGHSLGGTLALAVGEQAPNLPGDIVCVDGLPFLAEIRFPGVRYEEDAKKAVAAARQKIEKQAADQFAPHPPAESSPSPATGSEYAQRINEFCGRSDPATVAQARIEVLGTDFRPALAKIKCPILVLGALAGKSQNASHETLEGNYRKQYANAQQTRFEFFPGSRHYLMLDDPAGFYAALEKELAAHESAR
jgi:N-formylmaleamate deformylase